jgi:hypothetical protein
MLTTSLKQAIEFAKKNGIPRVIEIKCPRPDCGRTVYAVTDSDAHEHSAWLAEFKSNRFKRHIYCKHCSYGALGPHEGHFIFKTHHLRQPAA